MRKENAKMLNTLKEQEQESLLVIAELRKSDEKKDSDISSLLSENRLLKEGLKTEQHAINLKCDQKIEVMAAILKEKEEEYQSLKKDYSEIMDFKVSSL
jgi:hypothetical protein